MGPTLELTLVKSKRPASRPKATSNERGELYLRNVTPGTYDRESRQSRRFQNLRSEGHCPDILNHVGFGGADATLKVGATSRPLP